MNRNRVTNILTLLYLTFLFYLLFRVNCHKAPL